MEMQTPATAQRLESGTSTHPARLIALKTQVILPSPDFGKVPFKQLMHILIRIYKVHEIKHHF